MNQHYRSLLKLPARARAPLVSLFSITLLICLPVSALQLQLQAEKWRKTGSLATARTLHTATLLANGKVLVVGGFISGNRATDTAELYDPATGQWSATSSPATPRLNHIAVRLQNGKVLIAGGNPDAFITRLNTAEIYDPDTGAWSPAANMNVARQTPRATLLADGRVLVSGGLVVIGGVVSFTNTAEVYDPATNVWTSTSPMNSGRVLHTTTLLANGKVLAAGGTAASFNPILQGTAELYDPATNAWTLTGELTTPRLTHSTALLADGRVLVTGGSSGGNANAIILAQTEIYDPATGAWSATGQMTISRVLHTLTLMQDGKVLAAAGAASNTGGLLKSAELYDPAAGTWTATAELDTARLNHTAVLLPDGRVLVAGGSGEEGPRAQFNSAELFDSDVAPPQISGAQVSGKKLFVQGQSFDVGAVIFLNGVKQKTANDPQNPATVLIGKKAGKKIARGQTVSIKVRNSDGTESAEFMYTRP